MVAMSRVVAARRLLLGLVVIPTYGALLIVLLLLAIPIWLLNNSVAVLTGSGLFSGNSRLGYAIYSSQNNIQAVVTGRGQIEWVPI
jgi:hypothetical protein